VFIYVFYRNIHWFRLPLT